MTEHEKETEFLQHCIRYDESPGRGALADRISQIQRDEKSVHRAIYLMILLAALAGAGLCYAAVLLESFPRETSQLIIKLIAALGLAAVVCLLVFMVVRKVYRFKLDERREECRQLVTKLLAHRLGNPPAATRAGPAGNDPAS